MASNPNLPSADPYDLSRFLHAQAADYEQALKELRSGKKKSHWMWYIFPQFQGLGSSSTSRRYSIKSLAETRAYLAHPILGTRLAESVEAVLHHKGKPVSEIFDYPDDLKLHSCATLFAAVSLEGSLFHELLEQCFEGVRDSQTVELISQPHAVRKEQS